MVDVCFEEGYKVVEVDLVLLGLEVAMILSFFHIIDELLFVGEIDSYGSSFGGMSRSKRP